MKCNWCDKQTNDYKDYTIGGCANIVPYCKEHESEADEQERKYNERQAARRKQHEEVKAAFTLDKFNGSIDGMVSALKWRLAEALADREEARAAAIAYGTEAKTLREQLERSNEQN